MLGYILPTIIMTEFFVFMPLQGIAPENSWLEGVSLKDSKLVSKRKIKKIKTK